MGRAPDPVQARAAATAIVTTLRQHGHVAYFAGGCVRDELLGLRPTDYDVATDAPPQRIRELFPRTAEVGVAFGVVLVRIGACSVEVATFRSEGPYSDARRPDVVHFSDAPTDAARRDFTINALFLDPLAAQDSPTIEGHIVDYVGGLADLRAGMIRAVGDPDQRLAEDHLRALRAVRFTARLGFRLDPATAAAVQRHASELRGVSRERIGEEVRRMLEHRSRAVAVQLLEELGLDAPVLNAALFGSREGGQPPTLAALEEVLPGWVAPTYPAALAAWMFDRGDAATGGDFKPLVSHWRAALMLTNEERDELRDILIGVGILVSGWTEQTLARKRRAAAATWFPQALRVLAAASRARTIPETGDIPGLPERIRQEAEALASSPPGLAPVPLVTGDDLVAMGYRPGPKFKAVLDQVYDAQLEGTITSRAQAVELARRLCV